jgi:hypothetical protein
MAKARTAASGVWRGLLMVLLAPLPSLVLVPAAVALNLPWPIAIDARLALPYLALPLVHWCAFRAPSLLPSPVVLAAGILADIAAESPLGYWPLVLLSVLGSGRAAHRLLGPDPDAAAGFLALPLGAAAAFVPAMIVPFVFALAWPDPAPIVAGIALGVLIEAILIVIDALTRRLPAPARSGDR